MSRSTIHYAVARQMAEDSFLERHNEGAIPKDDLIIGMLYAVEGICDEQGIDDEGERQAHRQAAVLGFRCRWNELCDQADEEDAKCD